MVVSKCKGTDCLKKTDCHRYTVEPVPKFQPWMIMEVSIKEIDKCTFFMNNEAINEQSRLCYRFSVNSSAYSF